MRQDVGGDTWSFTWDLNGNLTEKTNGIDTWTYTFNDENRLVRVQGPGSVDVAYAYDYSGRMMSRDDGSDVTTFQWDGADMIRETTGMSTTTYCIPDGQLLSFVRNGDRYDVHSDHVMSVRIVTDDNGDVVLRREFDAWGNELAGSFDNVPGGMPYGFGGAVGYRKDSATSLYYVRARWYDPHSNRFISRDPSGLEQGENLYAYANLNPARYIDYTGEVTVTPPVALPSALPGMGAGVADAVELGLAQQAARAGLSVLLAEAGLVIAGILLTAATAWLIWQLIETATGGGSGGTGGVDTDEGDGDAPDPRYRPRNRDRRPPPPPRPDRRRRKGKWMCHGRVWCERKKCGKVIDKVRVWGVGIHEDKEEAKTIARNMAALNCQMTEGEGSGGQDGQWDLDHGTGHRNAFDGHCVPIP